MGITSLQVCMDSSNWLQDTIHDGTELDSSTSPSEDNIFTCSRPIIERKLRPPHDAPLNCPRCDSTHTKFCYYNNYSLSQPRYFCKSCRRYWTKGGTLRNIPVGGGCRKNKKISSKKSNEAHHNQNHGSSSSSISNNFPEMAFSQFTMGQYHGYGNPSFMLDNNPTIPIDFMESSRNQDFLGNGHDIGNMINGYGEINNYNAQNFPAGFCSTFGLPMEVNNNFGTINNYEGQNTLIDVKPNPKILSLEWHDQGCSNNAGNNGYMNGGLGSWTGLMNGYGSSTTNQLV